MVTINEDASSKNHVCRGTFLNMDLIRCVLTLMNKISSPPPGANVYLITIDLHLVEFWENLRLFCKW